MFISVIERMDATSSGGSSRSNTINLQLCSLLHICKVVHRNNYNMVCMVCFDVLVIIRYLKHDRYSH